jgi:hypothetical protein
MAEYKAESKGTFERRPSGKSLDDDDVFYSDEKGGDCQRLELPVVTVVDISIGPKTLCEVSSPLILDIKFELDRDVVAGFWAFKFLVDSSYNRLIRVLGESRVEDYPDGESDVHFEVENISVDGIKASTLTNSGLLMAVFMANGEEVATVNMVSQYLFPYMFVVFISF